MANKQFHQLPNIATDLANADVLAISQGGVTKQAPIALFSDGAVNVKHAGAKGDGVVYETGSMNASDATLTVSGASFTSADVGKLAFVQKAATQTITFPSQPPDDSTLTLNGSAWTFKASGATGNQSNKGADLEETLQNLVDALMKSRDTSINKATYEADATTLSITADEEGTSGNAFTVVASAGSNATAGGATLEGGVDLRTTVASVTSGTIVELSASPSAATTGARVTIGTDDTTALQNAATAGGDLIIPQSIFLTTGQITFGSAVTSILSFGRIITSYAGVQDSGVYPALLFSGFKGKIHGTLDVEFIANRSNTTTDGVQFLSCRKGVYAEKVKAENTRFGVLGTSSIGLTFGALEAETMRGWQGAANDNGGSVISVADCRRGYIGSVIGSGIRKAAVYFSTTTNAKDNKTWAIGFIDVELRNANRAVASGLALNRIVGLKVGSLESAGGIAGLFIDREASDEDIRDVEITKIKATDCLDSSSASNGIYINGASASIRPGRIKIGEAYVDGAEDNCLFIQHAEDVELGYFRGRNAITGRPVIIGGTCGRIVLKSTDTLGLINKDIIVPAGATVEYLELGHSVIRDRGSLNSNPIEFADDTVDHAEIGFIEDQTATPLYGYVLYAYSPASTKSINVQRIKGTAGSGVMFLREAISKVERGRYFRTSIPTSLDWPPNMRIWKDGTPAANSPGWHLSSDPLWKLMPNIAA